MPGTGGPPPEWARSMESVYPGERFIAVTGRGMNRQAAETAALAGIARYFQSEVRSQTASSVSSTSGNGAAAMSRSLSEETFVNSEVSLFAVRYTNAWRDSAAKEYVCAAYIDRDEAWGIYEPRLRSLAGPFTAAFEAAAVESDPLLQMKRYQSAARLAGGELAVALDFAQALAPERAAAFDGVRRALAGAAQKAADAKAKTALVVRCDGDMDGIIAGAITAAFSGGGFRVIRDEALSTNWAEARIDGGEQTLEAGTFYTPHLTVTVYGGGGAVFTWTTGAARQGARDPSIAQRRAWTALAEEVKRGLWAAFDAEMGK